MEKITKSDARFFGACILISVITLAIIILGGEALSEVLINALL